MTKKTTLSDEEVVRWHRHSCLCSFAVPRIQRMSDTVQSRDAEFLIANLELEFELSHRKQSALKISNRKYFAIFSLNPSSSSTSTVTQPSNPNSNIHTIRILANSRTITTYAFLPPTKLAFSPFASSPAFLLAKAHPAI